MTVCLMFCGVEGRMSVSQLSLLSLPVVFNHLMLIMTVCLMFCGVEGGMSVYRMHDLRISNA